MAGGRAARAVALASVGGLALTTAIFAIGSSTPPATAAGLTRFPDCAAVDDWFAADRDETSTGTGGSGSSTGDLEAMTADPGRAADAQTAVGNSETGTNLQEAGVDEPDVVKLSADRLLTAQSGSFLVVDVSSDTPRTLGAVALPAGLQSTDLLVVGNRVVAIGQPAGSGSPVLDGPAESRIGSSTMWAPSTTWIGVFDIANPSAPALVSASETEGGVVDARLTGDTVRVVTTSRPTLLMPQTAATDSASQSPKQPSGTHLLPHLIDRASGAPERLGPAISCTQLTHPADFAGAAVTMVSSIVPATVSGGDPVSHRTAVTAPGDLVYASETALYLATRSSVTADDRTEVHHFETTATGTTGYAASGSVAGTVIGRWAFSERDGVLRVATTRVAGDGSGSGGGNSEGGNSGGEDAAAPEPPPTDSAVTTLRRNGDTLEVVGEVAGLGRGERIQAVRWFDEVAYVVTFRQVDPLYVVDLTDPARPRVTGELKVPGFSSYLHPIGDGRLLGVGTAATDEGRVTGLQLSTFDVTDPAKPTLIDSYTRPGASSPVAADSRLFSYLPRPGLAVVPVSDESSPNVVLAVRVGSDGAMAVTARDVVPNDRGSYDYLQRVVPVGQNRLAALVTVYDQATGNPSTRLTMLDHDLTVTGSADLG